MEKEIKKFIIDCNDVILLRELHRFIYQKLDILRQLKTLDFEIGEHVKFQSRKENRVIYGTIVKITKRNIILKSLAGVQWTVPASLIKPAKFTIKEKS